MRKGWKTQRAGGGRGERKPPGQPTKKKRQPSPVSKERHKNSSKNTKDPTEGNRGGRVKTGRWEEREDKKEGYSVKRANKGGAVNFVFLGQKWNRKKVKKAKLKNARWGKNPLKREIRIVGGGCVGGGGSRKRRR